MREERGRSADVVSARHVSAEAADHRFNCQTHTLKPHMSLILTFASHYKLQTQSNGVIFFPYTSCKCKPRPPAETKRFN